MNWNWKTIRANFVLLATALFGFVVFSPETFVNYPWFVALAKFAVAGGLVSLGIDARNQAVKNGDQATRNSEALQAVDDKLDATHKTIDGRMEQLIQAAKIQGIEEGGRSQRDLTRKEFLDDAAQVRADTALKFENEKTQ